MFSLNPRISFSSLLFLFSLLVFWVNPSVSEPRSSQAALICSNKTSSASSRQIYIDNFLDSMDAISPPIAVRKYAAVSNGTGNDTVYAFGECMADLDTNDCNMCFAQIKTALMRCTPFQRATRGGRLFFDGCYIRYDDYNFYNESLSVDDRTVCANNTAANSTIFRDNAMVLARNLSIQAVSNNGFYAGFVQRRNVTVHGLAQCWEVLNGTGCKECLDNAASRIVSCLPREEGRVLNAGCYMRYSNQRFYNNSGGSTGGNGGNGRRLAIIIAVTSSAVAIALIIAAAGFLSKRNLDEKRRVRKKLGHLLANVKKSNLNFSYEALEKATNFFNNSNKLGQGGSGSVYKGTLPDGKIVAIKRLFFNTQQWVDHFFNEVNLISGIHHKNLVKLLGCSITGPESLLVYEYVPNQSLHDYLFVRKDVRPLSWRERSKIILDTAEGLMYLHEESSLRIIHRDIKLSNILLDEDYTAKIADFGLARMFPEDQSHISTAVAGTLGYMAPEYVVRGKLTEKADVYSFGVVLMEVLTGKRNNAFTEASTSILHTVWNLYGSNRLCEAVDPILCGDFDEEEAPRLFQIGLLCVQAGHDMRPSMSSVVGMINGELKISAFPPPNQPPYMNPGSAENSRVIPKPPPAAVPPTDQAFLSVSSGAAYSMTQSAVDPR